MIAIINQFSNNTILTNDTPYMRASYVLELNIPFMYRKLWIEIADGP